MSGLFMNCKKYHHDYFEYFVAVLNIFKILNLEISYLINKD